MQLLSQVINIDIILFLSHRTYWDFASVIYFWSTLHSRITHCIYFSCLLGSFNLKQFLRLLDSHDLYIFEKCEPVAFRMFLNLCLSDVMFLDDYSQVWHLGQEYYTSNIVSFLVRYIRRHMISICPFLVGWCLTLISWLMWSLSLFFFHWRIIIFHLCKKYLVERHI